MNAKVNDEFKRDAELTRLQTATLINIQLKKEDQIKPRDLWRFEWDDQETENESGLTEEQIIEHNNRLSAVFNNKD
ncbi:MAG TPA: hypothetical protein PKH68_01355 [Paludibacteraceae bacterium]|nr:hypothetical protein [Paludibacteraceae bacterium]